MAPERWNVGFIVGSVAVALIMLGALAHQGMGVKKWRSGFNEEMAQRLDLEEKMSRMEKERSVLMADLKQVSAALEKSRTENGVLRAALVREIEEKKALADRLGQALTPAVAPAAK